MRQQLNACMYVSAHILCVCARQIQISGYVHIGTTHKRVCAQWKFHERADYVMGLKKNTTPLISCFYPLPILCHLKKNNESLNGTVSF